MEVFCVDVGVGCKAVILGGEWFEGIFVICWLGWLRPGNAQGKAMEVPAYLGVLGPLGPLSGHKRSLLSPMPAFQT